MNVHRQHLNILITATIVAVAVASTGCIGAMAQLFYVIKGHDVPAAYSGFEAKRVAVVAVTEASSYGPEPLAATIQRFVSLKLANNVEEITVIPENEVRNWIDINGWDQSDFAALGSGVNADLVLGIVVDSYSIRDGSTMYKGRADVTVKVVDSLTGQITYSSGPEHFEYPENGRPALQTDDRRFEAFYLGWLTQRIARQFYKHDRLADVADDAAYGG